MRLSPLRGVKARSANLAASKVFVKTHEMNDGHHERVEEEGRLERRIQALRNDELAQSSHSSLRSTYDDHPADQDECPGCAGEVNASIRRRKGPERTHVRQPPLKVTLLQLVQAPVQHDQTEHKIEPSSAEQERQDEPLQLPVLCDPVRDEGEVVRADEVQEGGESRAEHAKDRVACKGRDLA